MIPNRRVAQRNRCWRYLQPHGKGLQRQLHWVLRTIIHISSNQPYQTILNELFDSGRLKELLITAGGENVAPVIAEDNIKAELPCVSNAVLIGDKKKYLSVFLTLKTVVKDDLPTDKLAPDAVLWCQVCSQVQFVLGAN